MLPPLKFSALFLVLATALSAETKPNIVFFLVDDFSAGALSALGSDFHETPHIDALFQEGMTFENGYSASAVCSPSRGAIMTGKAPARTHLTDWIGASQGRNRKLNVPKWTPKMAHEEITVAEAFQENGYRTGFFGKWHLMSKNDTDHFPTNHGFDINIGGNQAGRPGGKSKYFGPFNFPGLEDATGDDYLTEILTDHAIDFIEESSEKPFFLYFSYYTVHGPLSARQELTEKYRAKLKTGNFKQKNPVYAAMVEHLDNSVGAVIASLKEQGIYDNTIIVFTADNGANQPEYTGDFKNYKGYSHKGGKREPYLIVGPGIPKNASNSTPVTGMDFYPTLLARKTHRF